MPLINKYAFVLLLTILIIVCNVFLYFGKMESLYIDAPYIRPLAK